jgi:hypothetical protein
MLYRAPTSVGAGFGVEATLLDSFRKRYTVRMNLQDVITVLRCRHMRITCLATMMTLATMALPGCGGGTTIVQPDASVQPEAFELDRTWEYLGPSDGPHTLEISNGSMVYADMDGQWSSNWTITEYDNGLHRFQVVFESGTGTYLPVGQNMSGTYVLNDPILTVQLANGLGSYPPMQSPGSCTEGSTLIPDCRIYMKQN